QAPVTDVTITAPTADQEFTITPGQPGIDVTVEGTGEPDAEIVVTVGTDTYPATVAADGSWTVTVTDLPAGNHTATADQDADGVTSSDSVDFVVNAASDADSYEPAYASTAA